MSPIGSEANPYLGIRRASERTQEPGQRSASASAGARANTRPDLRRPPGPRETDSVLAPRAKMPRRVGTNARTSRRSELEPDVRHDSLTRKRPFEAPVDTQEAYKRQRLTTPFFDICGAHTARYTRALSSSQEAGPTAEHLTKCESRLGRADLVRLHEERRWGSSS